MLTLITGVPGSGKTLYAVSTVIQEYLAQEVELEDGTTHKRRVWVDGIKDLIIDHELMAPSKLVWVGEGRNGAEELVCEGQGLANWYEWCKPGDVILVDEVQRMWRPRGTGSKVPKHIEMLETHRHMGVDFVIITQHPMLIDQNVRRLIGRHLHIRRMWGMNRAVRYEWDHCSSPDKVGDAGKSYWPYPKDAFKYYKSAEVHTKQGGKVPAALFILALAAFALPVVGYFAVTRTQGMLSAPAKPAIAAVDKAKVAPVASVAPAASAMPTATPAAGRGAAASSDGAQDVTAGLKGCMTFRARCECFDAAMKRVKVEKAFCEEASHRIGMLGPLDAGASPEPVSRVPAVSAERAHGPQVATFGGSSQPVRLADSQERRLSDMTR